jgi:glucokinase
MRLALEIGGTKLQAALGTAGGHIAQTVRADSPADAGADAVRRRLADLVLEVRGLADEPIERVGVGFGGPVDSTTGRVIRSHQVTGWDGFDLAAWARDAAGVPAVVENDANCGALAEARLGAGRTVGRVLYMNVGSGIGGGVCADGRLVSGPLGGEMGHTWVWDAEAGGYAHLEDVCSGWSVARRARALADADPDGRLLALAGGDADAIDARTVARAVAEGDAAAGALLDDVAETLAVALASAAAVVAPERVVVGGGVAGMGEVLFGRLRPAFARRVFGPLADRCEVVAAEMIEENVLVGALLLDAST